MNYFKKYLAYLVFGLFVLCIFFVYLWYIGRLPTELEMHIFDTKSKPSIFIRTPQDERILINGGANSDIIRHITSVLPFYLRRIDMIIVTNDDPSNVTGLIDVISRYQIGKIIIPALTIKSLSLSSSTDQIYDTFRKTIDALKIPIVQVKGGDRVRLGTELDATILFPTSTTTFTYSKASSPELVMRMLYRETSFLLVGDISSKIQKYVAHSTSTAQYLLSDILFIPHSINGNSLSSDLIDEVHPKFVVYSQSPTTSTKSKKIDPLYSVMDDHRFNLKQKNTIMVLSDGKSARIDGEYAN